MLYGIYGTGGCGRGILPLVRQQISGEDEVVFVDDSAGSQIVNGARCLTLDLFLQATANKRICIAVADVNLRKMLDNKCRNAQLQYFSVFANAITIFDDVEIGEGALLSPYTTYASNIRIGRHFHCGLYSYVEHDCIIGDFVTFAPSARCNGNVVIGDGTYIGSNAVIRQGITIGSNAVVGMGAVVTKNVPAGVTVVGNPAKDIKIDKRQ